MAFSEFEIHRYSKAAEAYVETKRPPLHIRKELDIAFRLDDQSIEIYKIRPAFDNPEETMEHPVARATYVKLSNTWKIYWQRADLKWHGYEPDPVADSLEDALKIIDADEFGCFFG